MKAIRILLLLVALLPSGWAAPIELREISFWVRFGESEQYMLHQIGTRKLTRVLTAAEVEMLKAQHAPESVLKIVADPKFALTDSELKAIEAAKQAQPAIVPASPAAPAAASVTAESSKAPKLRTVKVKWGRPFNRGDWSGLGYGEVRFFPVGARLVMANGKPALITALSDPGTSGISWEEQLTKYQREQLSEIDLSKRVNIDGSVVTPILEGSGAVLYYIHQDFDAVELAIGASR